jgi:cell division protein FtsN
MGIRENSRVRRQRSGLASGGAKVTALLAAALASLGGAFLAGVFVGRQAAAGVTAAPVAARDALDHLDDPPAEREEVAPVLKAPQVLTDARPIERTMPLAPAKLVPSAAASTTAIVSRMSTSTGNATAEAAGTRTATATVSATGTGTKSDVANDGGSRPSLAAARPERKGAYTIQVASSASRADAERIAARLAGKEPRIVAADVPGKGRWYRVQVGSFPTQEAARRQLPQLARVGVQGLVVTSPR